MKYVYYIAYGLVGDGTGFGSCELTLAAPFTPTNIDDMKSVVEVLRKSQPTLREFNVTILGWHLLRTV